MRVVALTFALSAATATALGALRSNAFLSSEMRPDMVARLMTPLVGEWKAQAHVTAECKGKGGLPTCDKASRAFHSSCSKVVRAVMLSSSGDSVKVSEYMTTVCSQKTISGWQKSCCGFVGQSIVAKMSANSADNRENHVAKADATCNSLWARFVEEQTAEVAVEAAAKAKAKEEEEAKAKEEKEAKAKEDAKIAAAKSVEEEKAKIQEAEQKVATEKVKKADSVEAQIKAAFKIAPEAKVQEAGETADAKIAADAKTADAKIQEAEKKVGEKVKAADAIETKIQAAFKSAVALVKK